MNVRLNPEIKKGLVTKVPLKSDVIKTVVEQPESSENKTAETDATLAKREKNDGDKILGMPKMVAYGLGAVVLLVGGYFAYKKFKK